MCYVNSLVHFEWSVSKVNGIIYNTECNVCVLNFEYDNSLVIVVYCTSMLILFIVKTLNGSDNNTPLCVDIKSATPFKL